MENSVAKKVTQLPTTATQTQSQSEILTSDITLPRVFLMQGLSELVEQRKATPGDIVKSTTGEKLGDPETPVSFVPLRVTSEWMLAERIGGKFKYKGTEPRNAKNEDLPWEFEKNGASWKRSKVLNVYALLADDIVAYKAEIKEMLEKGEMPDINKSLLPVMISFRVTSFPAGKSVVTLFAQVQDMRRFKADAQPFHYVLPLCCKSVTNDSGTFYVYEVGKAKKLSTDLIEEASRWFDILNQTTNIKVDSDEGADEDVVAKRTSREQEF